MDTYHPEMQRWAHDNIQRHHHQERERSQAMAMSLQTQAAAKQQNHQHELLQAARLAGA